MNATSTTAAAADATSLILLDEPTEPAPPAVPIGAGDESLPGGEPGILRPLLILEF